MMKVSKQVVCNLRSNRMHSVKLHDAPVTAWHHRTGAVRAAYHFVHAHPKTDTTAQAPMDSSP